MGKKLSSLFESNKLVNMLLIAIVTAMLAGNSRLGSIESQSNSTSDTVEKLHIAVEYNRNELVAVKTQNTFLIDESHETKERSILTRNEQLRRSSSIKCIDKISDVMGCSVPMSHPK